MISEDENPFIFHFNQATQGSMNISGVSKHRLIGLFLSIFKSILKVGVYIYYSAYLFAYIVSKYTVDKKAESLTAVIKEF
ncbi:hypothetical protein Back11_39390 [Paenibacillus baekrokdamisoli]|uniref:Uncharacterized protein n=1 Tax=Paenibacillus baekrokdamisoli TaxID=1712516 RepID=A0A3G9JHT5_9BACL|nr:hypothetical protein Back11_39390 [Paenibacillus baekrokdamisoli]